MQDDAWVHLAGIGIAELVVHPLSVLDGEDLLLIELHRTRQGGMGGEGPLPEAGGYLDQAACTMASLALMGAAQAALRKTKGKT